MSEPVENWNRAYSEAPEIFDEFSPSGGPRRPDFQTAGGRCRSRWQGRPGDRLRDGSLHRGVGSGDSTLHRGRAQPRDAGPGKAELLVEIAAARSAGCANAERLPFADGTFDRVLAGWVVVNLAPAVRGGVLAEASRVLRPHAGAQIWLVENHWSGEFQELRGRRAEVEEGRIKRLSNEWGFQPVEVVETELRFHSENDAIRVLGVAVWRTSREPSSREANRATDPPRDPVARTELVKRSGLATNPLHQTSRTVLACPTAKATKMVD